jgi:hypothetical protein
MVPAMHSLGHEGNGFMLTFEEGPHRVLLRVMLPQATPESEIFERAMIDRIPLDELGAGLVGAGGRLVLLGDAAHAMHSGPGQGGRMGFEVGCPVCLHCCCYLHSLLA